MGEDDNGFLSASLEMFERPGSRSRANEEQRKMVEVALASFQQNWDS